MRLPERLTLSARPGAYAAPVGTGPVSQDGRTRSSSRPRFRALFVTFALAALVAIALAALLLSRSGTNDATGGGGDAALVLEGQRGVRLDPRVRRVAKAWILSAVNRSDLGAAYGLTHTDIRGTMSRSEWEGGHVPVVPYPVTRLARDCWKVESSLENEALLEVDLSSSDASVAPSVFLIGLKKVRGAWLVNYWSPRGRMRGGQSPAVSSEKPS